ncbi:MAG: hypothetical protein ABSE40_11940 [Candidatus Sulfotelmatobacter sp.]|jgi:hypothetical protein
MAALTTTLNTNPIVTVADSDTSSGWRSAVSYPSPGGGTKQWGIQVYKIALVANSASPAAAQVTISDPQSGTVLWSTANTVTSATIGQVLLNQDLTTGMKWRDFKIVGLTAASCALLIWYRA